MVLYSVSHYLHDKGRAQFWKDSEISRISKNFFKKITLCVLTRNSKNELIEVTALEDGTYSFELNDDVTIEVLFKEEVFNPKTGVSNIISLVFTFMLVLVSGLFVVRKYNKSYEL